MRFAILGSGAVGGYYGAKLARAGHDVTFVARGSHLCAIRERGLLVWSPLGDFVSHAPATDAPADVGEVDVVILAVKTYDNRSALPMLEAMLGAESAVLTLQNGVDSVDEVAAVAGERAVVGGATYVATGMALPGLIEQTGTHRRIVFGEVFGDRPGISARVARLDAAFREADIQSEPVADARGPLWEKFVYLAPFAAFTGAARLPIGPLRADAGTRAAFLDGVEEVAAVAKAEGIRLPDDYRSRVVAYIDALPGATRSSLLIDLAQGRRIEVEALQGSVVRRGQAAGVATPIMAALYAVLKPYSAGRVDG